MKKIARFIIRRHKAVAAVFLLLSVAASVGVLTMRINADIVDVLPSGNRTVGHFKDFLRNFNLLEQVTIVLEDREKSVEEHSALVETIAEKLKASPHIEYVDHHPLAFKNELFLRFFPLFLDERGIGQLRTRLSPEGVERQIRVNYQRLISPLGTPLESELIARDPLMINQILLDSLKRQGNGISLDMSTGFYITNDHSLALIFAKPKGKSKDMRFVQELRRELDAIIASSLKDNGNPHGVTVSVTGGHIMADEVRRTIRHDIISSSLVSVLLVGGLIRLGYRVRFLVLAAIGCTMFASLSCTLFVAHILFGGLNIVTSIVAALLIGLYVDYALHMVKRFGDELTIRRREEALEVMLVKTGPAVVTSALTTSLSFLSILVTKFEGLYELGVVSGIGVLICLAANLLLFGSLLFWLGGKGPERIAPAAVSAARGEGRFAGAIARRSRLILFSSALVIIVLGAGVVKLRFESDPERIGIRESEARSTIEKVNGKLNRNGAPLHLMVTAKSGSELTAAYDSMERLLKAWKERGMIAGYDSLNLFLPSPTRQQAALALLQEPDGAPSGQISSLRKSLEAALNRNGFDYDKHYIDTYVKRVEEAQARRGTIGLDELQHAADPRIGRFYNHRTASIVSYLYPPEREWRPQTVDTMLAESRAEGPDWVLLGEPVLFREIASSIIFGSAAATLLALLFNIGIVYRTFRNARYLLLTMLPVVLGFLLTFGIMGHAGVPLNVISIGTVALIFGLGVDYGIYVMQAYIGEDTRGIGRALRVSGKNVVMCAATTVAGCGSLVTAEFTGIASIGMVLTIGAVASAAAALVVLPALLHIVEEAR